MRNAPWVKNGAWFGEAANLV